MTSGTPPPRSWRTRHLSRNGDHSNSDLSLTTFRVHKHLGTVWEAKHCCWKAGKALHWNFPAAGQFGGQKMGDPELALTPHPRKQKTK